MNDINQYEDEISLEPPWFLLILFHIDYWLIALFLLHFIYIIGDKSLFLLALIGFIVVYIIGFYTHPKYND